jgi:hypothetical protein
VRSTSSDQPSASQSQLPATATIYRDANRQRPDLSTIALPPASRLAGTKISNVNAPLRQKTTSAT